jgi:acetyl-CoA carboxylase carboxyltransferase component
MPLFPIISIMLRKSYAGAHFGMLDKSIGADFVVAWPTARMTIVGAETAASVIFAREIRDSKNPEEMKAQRIKEYSDLYENAYVAADRSCVDEIIMPHDTRKMINRLLDILEEKNKNNKAFNKESGVSTQILTFRGKYTKIWVSPLSRQRERGRSLIQKLRAEG